MIKRREIALSCRAIGRQAQGAPDASPADLALGILRVVAPASPWQARALVACWWPGWEPATLEALLAAGRTEAIAAYYRPPSATRKGYAEAARALGASRTNVSEAVARGVESLYAWHATRTPRSSTASLHNEM